MIHEIFPARFNNRFLPDITMQENDYVLQYNGNSILMRIRDGKFRLPQKRDLPEIGETTRATFLFTLNDVPCFLVWDELTPGNPEFEFRDIGFFRTLDQKAIAWICLAGLQMANWYLLNKYCGKCGALTQPATNERAIVCLECKSTLFPNISPAIIVVILCMNKILLARNINFRSGGYSLIAGYADIGESLEEAVMREVKEEVGLDVLNIRYYKSQPWPLSGSMMTGFIAEADDLQPILVDGKEISEAAWFTRENLPQYPSTLSIAGEMIRKFERGEL